MVDEVPVPTPGPGELLVRVAVALTCGTDVKTFRRGHPKIPLPAPLGHEFTGEVAAAGDGVTGFRAGDAVVVVPTAPCGVCRLCRNGRENLCPQAVGRMLLGAFADYVCVPAHIVAVNVFPRPAGMAPVAAAGVEPLACVVHGASRVRLADANSVAILGDGPIALLFLQLARAWGAQRTALAGRHAVRLETARRLGADLVLGPEPDEALRPRILEWTGGEGAALVIECVGQPATWEEAATLAAPGGEVLLFGGCPADTRACFDTYRTHYEEVDLKGAFHYRPAEVRAALRLLQEGAVQMEPLVTHRKPLAELDEALRLTLTRQAIKVAVQP